MLLVEQKNPAKLVTINGKRGIDLLLLKLIRLQSILLYSCLPMGKISLNRKRSLIFPIIIRQMLLMTAEAFLNFPPPKASSAFQLGLE